MVFDVLSIIFQLLFQNMDYKWRWVRGKWSGVEIVRCMTSKAGVHLSQETQGCQLAQTRSVRLQPCKASFPPPRTLQGLKQESFLWPQLTFHPLHPKVNWGHCNSDFAAQIKRNEMREVSTGDISTRTSGGVGRLSHMIIVVYIVWLALDLHWWCDTVALGWMNIKKWPRYIT